MSSSFGYASDVSTTLQSVTDELRRLQDLLLSTEKPDPRILTEFREVVNRVRHTAWAVHQYSELLADQQAPNPVSSILAGERIRTVCQLCKLVETDLENPEVHLQDGQLVGLYVATLRLANRLRELTGN